MRLNRGPRVVVPLLSAAVVALSFQFFIPAAVAEDYNPNYFSEFLSAGLDDEGLDARDAQNRRLVSAESRGALKGIFVNSVFRLLVDESLPAVAAIRSYLEKLAAPLGEGFRRAAQWMAGRAEWVWSGGQKFEKKVPIFWLVMIFCMALASRFCREQFLSASSSSTPVNLPLRC